MNVRRFFTLIDTQARLALKAEASRLYLSYLWWIIEPLLYVAVFYFVFEVLLNRGGEEFLLFLLCGKIPFLWFSKSVMTASNSIVQNKGLVGQLDLPKTLFPYASVQEGLYKQWAVFLVLFGVAAAYGYTPQLHWLWLLPLIFIEYILIMACALIGALCVSFAGDFRMLISMGMTFLLFTSGIFWDVRALGDPASMQMVLAYNPMAFLLDAYRQVLMKRAVYDVTHLMILAAVSGMLLYLMHGVFDRASKIIAAQVVDS
ncbi:ABC transporter permease [Nitrospina watsonii]|uniref:Transport permease protein n=1 Tax=Nitrospina watsonii TaxID=1323948 RepID=A0ABN8VXY2_9BACT|nr:ABC transporter permease [Nitrospina watsonii]CAI2716983.1 Transport permease protein [Nitrospina watsonii]